MGLSLVLGLVQVTPVAAAPAKHAPPASASKKKSTPVAAVKPRAAGASATDAPGVKPTRTKLPSAGARVVAAGAAGTVGGLPVSVSAAAATPSRDEALVPGRAPAVTVPAPSSVRVAVADPSVAQAAGVHGVVMSLSRADKTAAAGRVHVTVDYSAFADTYGGDYGNRLRLVQMPGCVLSTPDAPACQHETPLQSTNRAGTVSADVPVGGDVSAGSSAAASTVVALDSSASSDGGTYEATPLSEAYGWSTGNQGGSFTYSYPLKVPDSLGGPAPQLALTYDSGSVDAKTLSQNGQASWVGEGWDLQTGFIERSYRPCKQNGGTTADLCWFTGTAVTMLLNGTSTTLVQDDTTKVWHASNDAGLKIEHLTGTAGGLGDNPNTDIDEYWRVTAQDGTQYYFGANRRYAGDTKQTSSVSYEPVFSNNAGEPCYQMKGSGFAGSWCQMGYQWALDYVVDPSGNSMTYIYSQHVGRVGANNNTINTTYTLSNQPLEIDYGTRTGSEASVSAPMRVVFNPGNRCTGSCAHSDYPDSPWDLLCSSTSSCPNLVAPVYWTPADLASVVTQVYTGGAYHNVDQWNLSYTFPSSGDHISPAGDDTSPNLWLNTITHTGYAPDGTSKAEPALTFGGTAMYNRKDWGNDIGVAPYTHYRLTSIKNGAGGQTVVNYNAADCSRTTIPDPETNTFRCFPQYFTPADAAPGFGWFQKYTVHSVTDQDLTGGSPDVTTTYDYSTAGSSTNILWHHDESEAVQLQYRSWSDWRGYSTVTATKGATGGPQTVTKSLYYRGMDGDGLPTADNNAMLWYARRVSITDSQPQDPNDVEQISGVAGKCVDLTSYGTANGTSVQLWDCAGSANQQWQYRSDGTIVNPVSGRCLSITGGGTANSTPLELRDCNGAAYQVWAVQADGSLKNPNSGRCVDAPSPDTANGTKLDISDCVSGAANQKWSHAIADRPGLQGVLREQTTMDGSTVVASTIHVPTVTRTGFRSTPVSGGEGSFAWMVNETSTKTRAWIAATNSWRWTQTDTSYDSYGDPTDVHDLADTSTTSDDTCTHTDYARNTTAPHYLINYPSQVITTDCAGSPGDSDYLSGSQTFYDGSTTLGAAPSKGLDTRRNALASVTGGTLAWAQSSRNEYDANGRVIAAYDALDRQTSTVYTPTTGGPVTQVKVTDPMTNSTTTTLDPGHGTTGTLTDANGKVTTTQYDPLGRLVKVWINRATSGTPDLQYTYMLQNGAANWVETQKLGPNGNQITSYQIYDGQLRLRQTQGLSPYDDGSRLVTDTTYDSRGLAVKTSTFPNDAAPSGTLVSAADTDVPRQHRYTYDNLERRTVDALWSAGSLVSQTSTTFDGDRTTLTPPAGGTATRTLTDARGNTTELDQYLGSTPSGTYQATTYGYDRLNQQTTITDPAGNTWTTSYDLRGRVTGKTDPDTGATTMTYDDAGQLTSTTDARDIKLSYSYDYLGRKTTEWQGEKDTGTKLADWTYDTLAKGQLTSSNRYTSSGTYTTAVTGYDNSYRPQGTTVTVPASDGFVPNSWTTSQTYNDDGSPAEFTYPAMVDLPAETLHTDYNDDGHPADLWGYDTISYVNGTWYTWDGAVAEINLTDDGSLHRENTYDDATGRLINTWTTSGDPADWQTWTRLLDSYFDYDPAGNVTDNELTEADGTGWTRCYTYDGLRQLTQAWTIDGDDGSGCATDPTPAGIGGLDPYWQTYTYDNNTGNRTKLVDHATTGDSTTTYTYPTGHTQPHTLTGTSTSIGSNTTDNTYEYDSAGNTKTRNLAGKPGQTLIWDPEGHLATITAAGNTTTYIYDANGNRLAAKDNNGETVYLGNTDVHRDNTGTQTCTRYYTYQGQTIATRTNTGALTWQFNDPHGTPELSIKDSDDTTTRLNTDPYGNPLDGTPWPTIHGFVNGITDPTGLTHLGAREYDPTTGRFISPDPLLETGDPQQLGGYTYAGNNPTTTSDPTGEAQPCPDGDCRSDGGGYGGVQPPGIGGSDCTYNSASCPNHPGAPAGNNNGGSSGGKKGDNDNGGQKPPAQKPPKKSPKPPSKTKQIASAIANIASNVSSIFGLLPGFICGICSGISFALSLIAAAAYFVAGRIFDAIITLVGAGLGAILGGVNFGRGFATSSAAEKVSYKVAEYLFDHVGGAFTTVIRYVDAGSEGLRALPVIVKRSPGFKQVAGAFDSIAAGAGTIMNGLSGIIQNYHDTVANT
jgi:RHS repeat-associated protein